jgi:hypothetical protein
MTSGDRKKRQNHATWFEPLDERQYAATGEREMTEKPHPAILAAEKKIQAILLDLANEHGLVIDVVNVDTRRFANYRTEIFEEAPRQKSLHVITTDEGRRPVGDC